MNKVTNPLIYFDNASTTLINPSISSLYTKKSEEDFANPSSIHHLGNEIARKIALTKKEILSLFRFTNHSVIALSSATEANNLAIIGYCLRYKKIGNHIITSNVEHPSVLNAFSYLEKEHGFVVSYLKVNEKGNISLSDLQKEIKPKTIFVSLMAVNNETGAINPIEEIASFLSDYPRIAFHCDAAQGIGKVKINYSNVDFLTVSAHKIHGLKSSALLIKRNTYDIKPLFHGGGQQNNFRSGTEDYPQLIAMKEALSLSINNLDKNHQIVNPIYQQIINYINNHPDLYYLNSHFHNNPYILNFSTINKKASVIVEALSTQNIMVSSLSACSSHHEKESYVIKNMTNNSTYAHNTIRLSFSYLNTIEEANIFIQTIDKIIKEIR